MESKTRLATVALFLTVALLIAGCSPAGTFAALSMGSDMSASGEMDDAAMEDMSDDSMESSEDMVMEGDGATATIATRSLRVRQAPDAESEVVYGVSEGEVYGVLGLSDDGQWVQIAVPDAEGGNGWVSSNYVSVSGALEGSTGDAPILQPTPVPSEESMENSDDEAMDDSMDGEAMGPPPAPEAGYATVYTDGTRLRVRAEPNTESEIVGYVYNDETYEVIDASDDGGWLNLTGLAGTDNPNGGWVAIEYLVPGQ